MFWIQKLVEKKIPITSSLIITSVLNTNTNEVENKIPDHTKYITTPEFNKLTAENIAARSKQATFEKELINLNRKVTSIKQNF